MSTTLFFNQIRDLIAHDEMEAALEQCRILLENSPKLDEVILQSARYHDIWRQIRLGIVSNSEANLTQNQIRAGLLDLLREMETLGATPALQREIEQAISITGSKNVVHAAQISAGGNVHIGDIVYTTPSSAGKTLAHDFNKVLTKSLVEAMRPYNEKAEKLCADFSWLEHTDNRRKVQQFVFQNFVGEIGKQMRKLVNIGDDDQMSNSQKERHYLEKCLDIARRSLDLVNYTLISVWWDIIKSKKHSLSPSEQQAFSQFFDAGLEHQLETQFQLLSMLCSLFQRHGEVFPFGEKMEALFTQLHQGSPLHQACIQLENEVQAGNSLQAEIQLAALMQHFAFLTRYRMVSIKKISYRQIRNGRPEFLHRYVAIGIDVKYSEDAEKGRWASMSEQTPAVLLYRGEDYQNGINLFPFVIDYNALTFEQGAKICFYSARDLYDENTLEYRFLGDNNLIRMEKKGVQSNQTKLDELMMNPDLLKALNLDCVIEGFHEARHAILGNPNDFFDQL